MPELKIWNAKQIRAYDHPPELNAHERRDFFKLPSSLQERLQRFHTPTNRVGFCLMVGYFKARKRFFTPARFHARDVAFVAERLGLFAFAADMEHYSRKTYARHQQIILAHFGYTRFDAQQHLPFVERALLPLIQSQLRPKLILSYLLDYLERQRIEQPPYHTLQTLVATAIRTHRQQLTGMMATWLSPEHVDRLDQLLQQHAHPAMEPPPSIDGADPNRPSNEPYLLTSLKRLTPSDRQRRIGVNLDKLDQLWALFAPVELLLDRINLSPDALRFFGELVVHYEIFQLRRRIAPDKYLYLLAFLGYQVRCFEDQMLDTFLSVCKRAINDVGQFEKERLFQNRAQHRAALRMLMDWTRARTELLKQIQHIAWAEEGLLSAQERVLHIQRLLPQSESTWVTQEPAYEDFDNEAPYWAHIEKISPDLQKKVGRLVRALHFNPETSDAALIEAVDHYRNRQGQITRSAPTSFLKEKDQEALYADATSANETRRFRVSIYKYLLFKAVFDAVKAGRLNLTYSYRYRAFEEYLIPPQTWQQDKEHLLKQAERGVLMNFPSVKADLETLLNAGYHTTNQQLLEGQNLYVRFYKDGSFHVKTPKSSSDEGADYESLFPDQQIIPLSEILATVERATGYLDAFEHLQPRYQKSRPEKRVFFAGITALGCNMGVPTMAKVAVPITAPVLERAVRWYFSLAHLDGANERITNYINAMELPNIYREHQDELHTSSDGQKMRVLHPETIYASYSFKYFGKGKGVTSYSFLDERYIPYYSTIINTSEREATYVIDGLLHNEAIRSTLHATDTHGYTEAVFGLTHLLGFNFAPRLAKLYKRQRYSFTRRSVYQEAGYKILPDGYINTDLIEQHWDGLLRLTASIKLKVCTASEVFKRLNSYSKQHPVYQALKEYGKIIKSLFILRYIDDVHLRQAIHRQLTKIELSNRLSKAIFFANGGEMIFQTREEQRIAEACKRLIKNTIICWNYLYLTQQVQHASDEQERDFRLAAVKAGSAMAWRHVYFHGLYDFSDEKLTDSFNLSRLRDLRLPVS